MPMRKTYSKRPYQKKPYKKSYRYKKGSRSVTRPYYTTMLKGPLIRSPNSLIRKFTSQTSYFLSPAALNSCNLTRWETTAIQAPNHLNGSWTANVSQNYPPAGFDTIGQNYQHYAVLGCRIRVRVIPDTNVEESNYPKIFCALVKSSNSSSLTSSVTCTALERTTRCTRRIAISNATGTKSVMLSTGYSLRKDMGIKDPAGASEVHVTGGNGINDSVVVSGERSNPRYVFLAIKAYDDNGVTVIPPCTVQVIQDWVVKGYERLATDIEDLPPAL